MTLKDIERAAQSRSRTGMRLRLSQTKEGWQWQWTLPNLPGIFSSGFTTAQTKPVALAMALGTL